MYILLSVLYTFLNLKALTRRIFVIVIELMIISLILATLMCDSRVIL